MLHKQVKKLWQGRFVSVRDYEVEQAIKKGGMVIHYDQAVMLIFERDLQKLLESIPPETALHKSRTGGKDYRLVDVLWKQLKPDETNQKELFNV